jgi:hypothetical protein
MNMPKALELSMYNIIRQHCELGDGVLVRPWQSLNEDGAFDPEDDRHFPCIDIRFSAPSYSEDQVTLVCIGQITAITYTEDDINHQAVSEMFNSIHAEALAIFRDACSGTETGRFAELQAYVAELDDGATNIGGITLEDGIPPADDGGNNVIGIAMGVHFTYA